MKSKILLVFACAFSFTTFSQDSIFQLKDYKYRTEGYRALGLSFYSDGYLTNNKTDQNKEINRRLGLSFQASYSRVFSSDKKVHTSSIGIYPSLTINSYHDNGIKETIKGFNNTFNWSFEHRFYKKKELFFLLGNSIKNNLITNNLKNPANNRKQRDIHVEDNLLLGFGKGRIEFVQDAQITVFILQDLYKQGLIDQVPDAKTTNDFAKLITDLRNRRIFDYRRKKIFELTQIESFLRERGIVNTTDIRHFTLINDNWEFAIRPFRNSGSSWHLQIQSNGKFNRHKTTTENINKSIEENNYSYISFGPRLAYENYVPVNLNWQRNMGASISWMKYRTEQKHSNTFNGISTEAKSSGYSSETILNIFYGLGYFPNSRTEVNANLNMDAFYSYIDTDYIYSIKNTLKIRPSFNAGVNYFLGYRTRLNGNVTVLYDKSYLTLESGDKNSSKFFTANFVASLTHSIF